MTKIQKWPKSWKIMFCQLFLKLATFLTKWVKRMVDTVLETWNVVLLSGDILVNICWPFGSTNDPWSVVKIWENCDFGEISCCHTGNIGQQVLTKLVLIKSMMSQLSKTVSNVSQSFLDRFLTFNKERSRF